MRARALLLPIAAAFAPVTFGQTLFYQWWYRDLVGSPCGGGFNTSNGVEITWLP